jgi:hypothetical protein
VINMAEVKSIVRSDSEKVKKEEDHH